MDRNDKIEQRLGRSDRQVLSYIHRAVVSLQSAVFPPSHVPAPLLATVNPPLNYLFLPDHNKRSGKRRFFVSAAVDTA